MSELQKIILDFIEKHGGNMDVWIKSELGEIVGIDLSRNDLPAEEPQQPPKTPHLADLLTPPTKVPYIAKYALASAANDFNAAASSMKPFTTENEPLEPVPGSIGAAREHLMRAAAATAKEVQEIVDEDRKRLEQEMTRPQFFCAVCGKVNYSRNDVQTCECPEPDFRYSSHEEYLEAKTDPQQEGENND